VAAPRLDRRTVVVTRTKGGEDALAARLRELGATVRELRSIGFAPPADPAPLDAALRDLGRFEWAVFASATAVERTVERLAALGLDPAGLASFPPRRPARRWRAPSRPPSRGAASSCRGRRRVGPSSSTASSPREPR
jgi:hypothetical protein